MNMTQIIPFSPKINPNRQSTDGRAHRLLATSIMSRLDEPVVVKFSGPASRTIRDRAAWAGKSAEKFVEDWIAAGLSGDVA